jgi:hypothetical protein
LPEELGSKKSRALRASTWVDEEMEKVEDVEDTFSVVETTPTSLPDTVATRSSLLPDPRSSQSMRGV